MTAVTFNVNEPEAASLLVSKFKTALPTAGQPLCDGIVIAGSGKSVYLTIRFKPAVSEKLYLTSTVGGVADDSGTFNAGTALVAGQLYQATLMVVPGETINLTYGANGGNYSLYIAANIQGAK